jgi:hypothetical protein
LTRIEVGARGDLHRGRVTGELGQILTGDVAGAEQGDADGSRRGRVTEVTEVSITE